MNLDEDIKLNSNVFHWPEQIQQVFDINRGRLTNKRESAEEKLKARSVDRSEIEISCLLVSTIKFLLLLRIKAFEARLNEYKVEVESFKKKEVASTEEMQKNVKHLADIGENLEKASVELEVTDNALLEISIPSMGFCSRFSVYYVSCMLLANCCSVLLGNQCGGRFT